MRNDKKAFAVAMYATRFDPEQILVSEQPGGLARWKLESHEDEINLSPDVHVSADFLMASSAEDATANALEMVLSKCPKDDGWIAHHATAVEVGRDLLLDAVRASASEEDDDSGPVM